MSGIESIDQGLMAKKRLETPQEQAAAAGQLRAVNQPSGEGDSGNEGTFKQAQSSARNSQKNEGADKKDSDGNSPLSMATAGLLKASWGSLVASFGLTLIYINLHVFGLSVLGKKVFCELGEEWIPKGLGADFDSPAIKAKIKKIGFLEKMGLILLDLLLLFCLLMVAILIVTIVTFVAGSLWDKIRMTYGFLVR